MGPLVDISVVVLEAIHRHGHGRSRVAAALHGARSVAVAALAATLATIAVLLPVVLLAGLARRLFVPLAITVATGMRQLRRLVISRRWRAALPAAGARGAGARRGGARAGRRVDRRRVREAARARAPPPRGCGAQWRPWSGRAPGRRRGCRRRSFPTSTRAWARHVRFAQGVAGGRVDERWRWPRRWRSPATRIREADAHQRRLASKARSAMTSQHGDAPGLHPPRALGPASGRWISGRSPTACADPAAHLPGGPPARPAARRQRVFERLHRAAGGRGARRQLEACSSSRAVAEVARTVPGIATSTSPEHRARVDTDRAVARLVSVSARRRAGDARRDLRTSTPRQCGPIRQRAVVLRRHLLRRARRLRDRVARWIPVRIAPSGAAVTLGASDITRTWGPCS